MTYREAFRPQIHFSPQRNWLNDPNGCIYFDGLYHMYYQYHPYGSKWGPMHWGHAQSQDLIHWEEQPIALYPDETLGMSFSGSSVIDLHNESGLFNDGEGLIAFYTAHLPGNLSEGTADLQQQCVAYSTNHGVSWTPYAKNPVIPNPGKKDFRDPKVFYHTESRGWVMLLSGGHSVEFYRSNNLLNWEHTGMITQPVPDLSMLWECPELFSLPDETGKHHWVLVVSCLREGSDRGPSMQYFLGDFNGKQFVADTDGDGASTLLQQFKTQQVDYASDFYAAQSWNSMPAGDTRKVWIGWVNNWIYANEVPTDPWRGVMSIPRELSLTKKGDRLLFAQKPVAEVTELRETYVESFRDAERVHVDTIDGESAYELLLTVKDANCSDISLAFSNEEGEAIALEWNAQRQELFLNRKTVFARNFSQEPMLAFHAEIVFPDSLEIRIFYDRSLIEVFAADGAVVFTSQLFPRAPLTLLNASASHEGLFDLTIYRLASIWNRTVKDAAGA